jgi:hypothetical protein
LGVWCESLSGSTRRLLSNSQQPKQPNKIKTMKTKFDTLPEAIPALDITATFSAPVGIVKKDYPTAKGWLCIRYDVILSRNGRKFWSGPYHIGIGHIKPIAARTPLTLTSTEASLYDAWKKAPSRDYILKAELASMVGKVAVQTKYTPAIADILHCLLMDGSSYFDAQSFEEWCSELGYDSDSRKAEKTFQECQETGRKLSRAFNPMELSHLRNVAQDY